MKVRAIFAAVVCASFGLISASLGETIRAYHIGNSLTDNINYPNLAKIAALKGDKYVYAKDVSPGVPLDDTWEFKTKTGTAYTYASYGLYDKALKNFTWDVLTLEPFDNWIPGPTGDLQISEDFIDYAIKKSPNIQTYIYERWPRRPVDSKGNYLPFDYTKLYTTPYTSSINRYDLADERQGYFTSLVKKLDSALPKLKKKVDLVPVGDVFEALDKKAKAKQLKGITSITQFYADSIHMNAMGSYVISLTYYATMFDKSPVGTSVPGGYGKIGGTLASEIQNTVWNVVTHDPLDGIHSPSATPALGAVVPEPMGVIALALLPLMRRRARGV